MFGWKQTLAGSLVYLAAWVSIMPKSSQVDKFILISYKSSVENVAAFMGSHSLSEKFVFFQEHSHNALSVFVTSSSIFNY